MNASCALYRNDINGDIVLTVTSGGQFEFSLANSSTNNLYVGGETLYA